MAQPRALTLSLETVQQLTITHESSFCHLLCCWSSLPLLPPIVVAWTRPNPCSWDPEVCVKHTLLLGASLVPLISRPSSLYITHLIEVASKSCTERPFLIVIGLIFLLLLPWSSPFHPIFCPSFLFLPYALLFSSCPAPPLGFPSLKSFGSSLSTKGPSSKCWRKLTRGGGAVSQMLTIADEGIQLDDL